MISEQLLIITLVLTILGIVLVCIAWYYHIQQNESMVKDEMRKE